MSKYPIHLADLSEKELAEFNFTALLYLHLKIDRVEECLEHMSKQTGYEYHAIKANKPVMHLGDMFQKIDSLTQSLESNISSDIVEKKNK